MPPTTNTSSTKQRIVGFDIMEDRCIWMKAGVVNYRICDNAFDCNTCGFDRAMRKAMQISPGVDSRTVAPAWVQHLIARYDGANRPCRHALTGRISAPKACPHNYECYHCAFDQLLDEADPAADATSPVCHAVAGFKIADGYYYHLGHSWVRFDHGGRMRIGLDDFAACLFGHLDRIDLPPLGAEIRQDQVGWTIGRDTHRAAVLAPVTGTVLAVNHPAREHPQLVSEDPYGRGWLFIVEPDLPKRNLRRLFFGRETIQWIDREVSALLDLLGPPYERLAATGGSVDRAFLATARRFPWETMAERFLHTARNSSA